MFRGTGTAIITPFKNDGTIDFESFAKILDFQIDGDVDALVILGTTGEAATLTEEERNEVISFAVEHVAERAPIIVGTGTNNTATTIKYSQKAQELGADGVLVVTPYYNKPTQEGLYQHFKAVANSVNIPIILYNVPGRTGCNMSASTVLRLASISNIVGVKEASGDQYQCDQIIRARNVTRPDFKVYSGNDDQAFHLVCGGGDGVISVLSNICPSQVSAMVRATLDNEVEIARELHLKMLPLMKDLFVESNPIPVKYAAYRLGLCENMLRLPLVVASANAMQVVDADLAEMDLDE